MSKKGSNKTLVITLVCVAVAAAIAIAVIAIIAANPQKKGKEYMTSEELDQYIDNMYNQGVEQQKEAAEELKRAEQNGY